MPSVRVFLGDSDEPEWVATDPALVIPLQRALDVWQDRNDISPPRLSSQFGKMLQSATNYSVGVIRHRTGPNHTQKNYYTGITLKPEWVEVAESRRAELG